MCGICGYANFKTKADEKFIHPMMDKLISRGPDDFGVYKTKNVVLGHRRLSIIDLTTGHQPIYNEDKTIAIVQNGEFYNFADEKNSLIKRGHRFQTNSDAEIAIHLYEDKGVDAISELEGMFAFCLYDSKKNILLLCRDRLGQKPLYYSITKDEIIFASELKSLMSHPSTSRKINIKSLKKYFLYDYVPGKETIYANVYKLPAASYLTVDLSKKTIQQKSYWDIPCFEDKNKFSADEAKDFLNTNLKQAVKKRLRADVPVGILLSGGIDSSTISLLAKELLPENDIQTFSIGFKDTSYDESSYSTLTSNYLGTRHHHFYFSEEKAFATLQKIKKYIDEPFADPSFLPTYFLSENVQKHVKVALGGDGADELFAGYQAFPLLRTFLPVRNLRRPLQFLINAFNLFLPTSGSYTSYSYHLNRFSESLFCKDYLAQIITLFGSFSINEIKLLAEDNSLDLQNLILEDTTNYLALRDNEDPFSKLMFCLAKLYLGDGILVKLDRASMANSLEVRSPFLDHNIFNGVFSCFGTDLKFKGYQTKYILKETFKNRLPEEIISRPKRGFAMPLSNWIKSAFKDEIISMLNKKRISDQGLLNSKYVSQITEEHFSGKKDHRKKIWSLLMFQYWHENGR